MNSNEFIWEPIQWSYEVGMNIRRCSESFQRANTFQTNSKIREDHEQTVQSVVSESVQCLQHQDVAFEARWEGHLHSQSPERWCLAASFRSSFRSLSLFQSCHRVFVWVPVKRVRKSCKIKSTHMKLSTCIFVCFLRHLRLSWDYLAHQMLFLCPCLPCLHVLDVATGCASVYYMCITYRRRLDMSKRWVLRWRGRCPQMKCF